MALVVVISCSYGLIDLIKRISAYFKRHEEQLNKIIELLQKMGN